MSRIERATPEQAERLFNIMVQSTEAGCAASYPPEIIAIWHKGRSVEGMAKVIGDVDMYSLIDEDRVRGFIHIGDGEIVGLCVHPDDYRKGYGAALFRFAVEKIGTRPVQVLATLNAAPFYARMGCRKIATELVRRHDHDIYVERMELA